MFSQFHQVKYTLLPSLQFRFSKKNTKFYEISQFIFSKLCGLLKKPKLKFGKLDNKQVQKQNSELINSIQLISEKFELLNDPFMEFPFQSWHFELRMPTTCFNVLFNSHHILFELISTQLSRVKQSLAYELWAAHKFPLTSQKPHYSSMKHIQKINSLDDSQSFHYA